MKDANPNKLISTYLQPSAKYHLTDLWIVKVC